MYVCKYILIQTNLSGKLCWITVWPTTKTMSAFKLWATIRCVRSSLPRGDDMTSYAVLMVSPHVCVWHFISVTTPMKNKKSSSSKLFQGLIKGGSSSCCPISTVGGKKDSTKRYLWSKTIITTGSVGRPGVDPPPRKINSFFLRSLALSVPIYRHFQLNGANWRSSKHLSKKFM